MNLSVYIANFCCKTIYIYTIIYSFSMNFLSSTNFSSKILFKSCLFSSMNLDIYFQKYENEIDQNQIVEFIFFVKFK